MRRLAFTVLLLSSLVAGADWNTLKEQGDLALREGRYPDAVTHFQKLVTAFPQKVEARNALGFALYKSGQLEKARHQFRVALTKAPSDPSTQANVIMVEGRLALGLGYQEGLSSLDRLTQAYSNNARAIAIEYYRGKLHFLNGYPERGLTAWKKVAKVKPESGTAAFLEALQAHRGGDLETAQKGYLEALQRTPDEVIWMTYLAALLLQKDQPGQAYLALATQLDLYPNYHFLRSMAAQARPHQASQLLESVGSAQARLQLGLRQRELLPVVLEADQRPVLVLTGEPSIFYWLDWLPLGRPPLALLVSPTRHQILATGLGRQPFSREFEAKPNSLVVVKATSALELTTRPRRADQIP